MKLYTYKLKRVFVKEIEAIQTYSPASAAQVIRSEIDFNRDQEQLILLCLDGRNTIKGTHLLSIGILDSSIVHPREVYKTAILSASAAIILGHNHPSNDEQPSSADRTIHQRMVEAGKLMGIRCLDHIIVTESSFYSFKENETTHRKEA